ncbi:intracellular serine protease [Fusarium tjaetaba]|uniref:Intracellular serine protease n=1 Tax=Fusarium tjaetaba TaxID=1567544 RepID=A0A8H5W0M9_9HYPO|nr:intracellular serine protease [Fusarium tjaetaba]KAF5642481.1 intracellular serine protease [Fusarium tjaetaba]
MSESYQNDTEGLSLDMYEAGEADFHVFNVAPDQYHRQEALQRTGAVEINCSIEKVVHGALAPDSDYYATLIVMHWSFQPKNGRRVSEATIQLLFEAESSDTEIEVKEVSFSDTYSLMPTTQDESVTKGAETTVGVEQVGQLSLTGKWEKTVKKTTSDAITLSGGKRMVKNMPPNRIARWVISENESQQSGIPTSLKVAVFITRDDEERFRCKLGLDCKTDLKTQFQGLFRKIPKDDPIIFQPDPEDKGTRSNKNVTYGDEDLGSVNLDELSDVTFRRVISDGQKVWR